MDSPLIFEQARLRKQLSNLPPSRRVAFAASAAERQLNSFAHVVRPIESVQHAKRVLADLWVAVLGASSDNSAWGKCLEEVMGLLPEEDDDTIGSEFPFLEDAITSLAYAIRCLLTSDAGEAAWAGQCAYEAADQAAIRILHVHPGDLRTEEMIRSHSVVQRELRRQQASLEMVQNGQLAQLRAQAAAMCLLSKEEAATAME